MSKVVTKKTVNSFKPGFIYGLKEVFTQTNHHLKNISNHLNDIGRSFGFLPVYLPILEEEKTYLDYHKLLPVSTTTGVAVPLAGKNLIIRSSSLPAIFRFYGQYKIFEELPISKWYYFNNILSQDERGVGTSDFEYGFEVLGSFNHLAEAQVISAVWELYKKLGLDNLELHINMAGDQAVQNSYQNVLKDFLKQKAFDLCDDCNQKIQKYITDCLVCSNLDCQVILQEAPSILDYLDENAKDHFTNILEALDELNIPYQLNPLYFGGAGASHTNFVIRYTDGKNQVVLGEGAYHTNLTKGVLGKPMPAFGFSGKLSVLLNLLQSLELELTPAFFEVFLVPLGETASKKSLKLFRDLATQNITVYDHFGMEGVKNQLKLAVEHKAPVALIMGHKEAMDDVVILRDVKSGMQEVFPFEKVIDEVKKRLGK